MAVVCMYIMIQVKLGPSVAVEDVSYLDALARLPERLQLRSCWVMKVRF